MKNIDTQSFELPNMASRQLGVTLIEALVTLLVLSVGALGIASMQLAGLKYTSGSYARTQAVILADDMANRLKSNRAFAVNLDEDDEEDEDGDGDAIGVGESPYELETFNTANPTPVVDCRTVQCTAQQLANYDIQTWRNEIARVLPSGRGSIQIEDRDVNNGITERQFNIAIQWRQVSNSTQVVDGQGDDLDPDDELRSFTFRILL